MDVGIENLGVGGSGLMLTPSSLIRRLNQIHQALFSEEAGKLGITLAQMNVLAAIARQSGRDQSSIAEDVGADKATLASVVMRLEGAGLIRRRVCKADQRQKLLHLTVKGRNLLQKMQEPLKRANHRTLEPLAPAERKVFVSLLVALVNGGNDNARTKLRLSVD